MLGLSFLTKAEVFIGGTAGVWVGIILTLVSKPRPWRRILQVVCVCIIATIAPVAAATVALSVKMPIADAFHGMLGTWPLIFDSRVTNISFYRWVSGRDDVAGNLKRLLEWMAGFCAVFAPVAAACCLIPLKRVGRTSAVTVWIICFLASGTALMH